MVKPTSTQAIETGTETDWGEWCTYLDASGAANLDHNAIVKIARKFRPISGWWAQGVAVAYEQRIGRRKPGQTSDGLFSVSISRTIDGNVASTHETWCRFASKLTLIGRQEIAATATTSVTPKRLYWRCKLDDGSAAAMSMAAKNNTKVLIVVEHNKLPIENQLGTTKQAWASLIAECFES